MSVSSADFAIPGAVPAVTPVLVRAVRAINDWIKRRYAIHTHRRILHSMPDHILEDIGISRSQIDGIVPERLDRVGRRRGPYPVLVRTVTQSKGVKAMDMNNRYRRRQRYRAMLRELKGFSQHKLAELDISQREIERVAYAAIYGRA